MSDMKTYIETKLRELGEEKAVEACLNKDANTLLLSCEGYGGGGQEGDELIDELTKLGLVVKLAGLCGKQVTVLP